MEYVAGEQGLPTGNFFPYKSFKFPQSSSCHKNSLCSVRLKLGHFHIFGMLFSFLAFVLYHDRFW